MTALVHPGISQQLAGKEGALSPKARDDDFFVHVSLLLKGDSGQGMQTRL
jgi:hypothetical protein